MPRRKTGRRRCRPRKATAKRRATTRQGRRTGQDPIDLGAEGVLKRRRAVAGGRTDIETVDTIGLLAANQLIDADELAVLRWVEGWLGLVRRARARRRAHSPVV